jgi:hypothetical protein
MFKCLNCGAEYESLKVKCSSCKITGRIAYFDDPSAEKGASHSPPPLMSISKPVYALSKGKSVEETPPLGPRLSATTKEVLPSSPPRVMQRPLIESSASIKSNSPQNIVLMRSEAGRTKATEVLKTFTTHGLLVRSVQLKHCECILSPNIEFDSETRDVPMGTWIDGYTYAHPSIAQIFFQLSPSGSSATGEGKRAMALVIDWTKTEDRYFDYSTGDMSANKQALSGAKTKELGQCARDMGILRRELGDGRNHGHNEVRFIQIHKESLVGLIWCPIALPTPLSDGRETWDEVSKGLFARQVEKFKTAGTALDGLPIFTYEVNAGMTLEYLDFIS